VHLKNIIFDLDGTLIDSYEGIQKAFNAAFEAVYQLPCLYNIRALVGPPINDIFVQVTGEKDQDKVARFVKHFRKSYDEENYKICELYEDVQHLLNTLAEKGIRLFIATNKRSVPTQMILRQLYISKFFTAVYSIDSVNPPYASKEAMVKDLQQKESINAEDTILIGDTYHDYKAAQENNIKFLYASYGFGELQGMEFSINKVSEITDHLN
jgi:phosphoglycolate phosphatase